jgi:hypothetical protein
MSERLRAFRLSLKDTGYVEGENVAKSKLLLRRAFQTS